MSTYSVGRDVKCYCGSCKLSLYHTIVSMDGSKPHKVQCNTCKGTHSFKDAPGTPVRRSGPATPKAKVITKPVAELWREQMQSSTKRPKAYSIREVFSIGDIIEHVSFGQGIVQSHLDNDKIEVMFETDIKTLVHSK